MRPIWIVALLVLLAVAAARADERLDPAQLVGDWQAVSGVNAGQKIPAERLPGKVTFTKETITLANDQGKFVFNYKVDPAPSPAHLDMSIKESPFGPDATVTKGLIQLKDGQLTLGYVTGSDKYPDKLESTAGNGMRLFVLKKAK